MKQDRVTLIIETEEGLTSCDIQMGNYRDPQFVGRMFGMAIQRYEADPNGRIASFKIERIEDLQ